MIAIDGPSGSGKSTVARTLAGRLGLAHLDTGAMYRAVTWAVLRDGADPADADAATALAVGSEIEFDDDAGNAQAGPGSNASRVTVDGTDVTTAIRGPEVTGAVSAVSAHPGVREQMVARQRQWAADHGGGVVEGRDIGSVVFPDADLKAYLTASEEERARRRAAEARVGTAGAGDPAGSGRVDDPVVVARDLARRDHVDSTRAVSPLTVADGAVVVDTTLLGVEEIVDLLMSHLEPRP